MSSHRRRFAVATFAVAAALLAGLTAFQPAPDTYVALGDSYAAGPLILPQSLAPAGCLRSGRNYPAKVRPTIRVTKFRDVSCSGARTKHFTQPQDVDPDGPNPAQFLALDHQTKVVTVTMGGNDIGFSDIVKNCGLSLPNAPGCKRDYVHDGRDEISEAIAGLRPKLDAAYAGINARATRAEVFVIGYPTVIPETGNGCYPIVTILPSDIPYLRAKVKELNATIKTAATKAGATYVDIATPSIGHDFCAGTKKWVEGIVPTTDAAPVHPNARGMAATGRVMAAKINSVVTS